MKFNATGIIRRIDELGRLVIPMEMRRALCIKESDLMEICASEDGDIIIRPYRPGCACCRGDRNLTEVDGIFLCPSCVKKFWASLFGREGDKMYPMTDEEWAVTG